MKNVPKFTIMLLVLFSMSSFRFIEDSSSVKHLYSKVVLKRSDKAQSIAIGIEGQEVVIDVKTKELIAGEDRGTELWIKATSIYQGQKVKSKQHRYMVGADAYQEHIIIRHINRKTKQVTEFQLNVDIQIIDSESELDLNV